MKKIVCIISLLMLAFLSGCFYRSNDYLLEGNYYLDERNSTFVVDNKGIYVKKIVFAVESIDKEKYEKANKINVIKTWGKDGNDNSYYSIKATFELNDQEFHPTLITEEKTAGKSRSYAFLMKNDSEDLKLECEIGIWNGVDSFDVKLLKSKCLINEKQYNECRFSFGCFHETKGVFVRSDETFKTGKYNLIDNESYIKIGDNNYLINNVSLYLTAIDYNLYTKEENIIKTFVPDNKGYYYYKIELLIQIDGFEKGQLNLDNYTRYGDEKDSYLLHSSYDVKGIAFNFDLIYSINDNKIIIKNAYKRNIINNKEIDNCEFKLMFEREINE